MLNGDNRAHDRAAAYFSVLLVSLIAVKSQLLKASMQDHAMDLALFETKIHVSK